MYRFPNDRSEMINLKYLIQLRRTKDEMTSPSPSTPISAILAFSKNIPELEKMQMKLLRSNLK